MSYEVLVNKELKEVDTLWKGVYLTKNSGQFPIRDALAGYMRDPDFRKDLVKGLKVKEFLNTFICGAGIDHYCEGITTTPSFVYENSVYVSHRNEADYYLEGTQPSSLIILPDSLSRKVKTDLVVNMNGSCKEVLTLQPNTKIIDKGSMFSGIYVAPSASNSHIVSEGKIGSSIYCYAPNCNIIVKKGAKIDNLFCTGRGSVITLENGSDVGRIVVEGGVTIIGNNGVCKGISPGRLLTDLTTVDESR